MFGKIKEKILGAWRWLKADRATWKNRLVKIGIIGLAFASGSRLTQTTIAQVGLEYSLNPAVQTYYSLGNNILTSKTLGGYTISVGKEGETYFLPEVKIQRYGKEFSILPKGIGSLDNANFDISATGTIKYEDDDNGIDYLYYFNSFGGCNSGGLMGDECGSNFKWEVVLPSYSTSTFWFNATSTFTGITTTESGMEFYDTDFSPDGTTTAFTILPVEFVDALGNRQNGTTSFEATPEGLFYKIEVDDTWLQEATFPVRIDPSYLMDYADNNAYASRNFTRDSTGIYYACYANSSLYFASSTDGVNWTTSTLDAYVASPYTGYGSDCNVVIDSTDKVHLITRKTDSTYKSALWYRTYTKSGGWASGAEITSRTTGSAYAFNTAVDSSDNVHVIYNVIITGGYRDIYYIKKTGASWGSETQVTHTTNQSYYNPNIAVDSANNLHIVYSGYLSGYTYKQILYKKYSGGSWGSETRLSDNDYKGMSIAWIAITSNDYLHVVWHGGSADANIYDVYYKKYTTSWQSVEKIVDLSSPYTANYSASIGADRSDNLIVAYSITCADCETKYQIHIKKYENASWGSATKITSGTTYGNNYNTNVLWANHPTNVVKPRTGYGLTYMPYGYFMIFLSSDISFSNPKYQLIKSYDYNSSATGTARLAWKGILHQTSTPVFNILASSTWIVATPTAFTAYDYSLIQSDNTTYATTSPTSSPFSAATSTLSWYWLRSAQKYQFCIDDNPKQFRDWTWEWKGYITGWATSSATTTKAQRVAMYIYDQNSDIYRLADEELNGACRNTECTLSYSTTSNADNNKLMNYFFASSSRWCSDFVVAGTEAWSDCRQDAWGSTLVCNKFWYDTLDGTTTAIGCMPQSDSEDLNNECPEPIPNNIPLGCKTGYCGGLGTYGATPWACNWYYDNAQHDCPQCYGCPESFNPTQTICEAKSSGPGTDQYSCIGECNYCAGGTCEQVENYQSGACTGGELCCDGACQTINACHQICNTCGTASCRADGQQMQCLIDGGTPDGNGVGCLPNNFCCCGA